MRSGIGLVGASGRMGNLVIKALDKDPELFYEIGYSRQLSQSNLKELFVKSDCVIDFSVKELLPEVLANAALNPKPLLICTTGWQRETF